MPELPEVEHLRLSLIPRLVGRTVSGARLHRRDVVVAGPAAGPARAPRSTGSHAISPAMLLVKGTIVELKRVGKQLAIVAGDGRVACIHLGMSGQLRWLDGAAPYRRAAHEHVTWRLDDGSRLAFRDPRRFGGVWLFPSTTDLDRSRWSELGPDALSITAAELRSRVAGSGRPLKAALLDQAVIAGVGNIYADEALFDAGLSPLRSASKLGEAEARTLVHSLQRIMRASIASGGSTLRDYLDGEGNHGTHQLRFAAYGRTGQPCPRCARPMRGLKVAQRTTVMCPSCQY